MTARHIHNFLQICDRYVRIRYTSENELPKDRVRFFGRVFDHLHVFGQLGASDRHILDRAVRRSLMGTPVIFKPPLSVQQGIFVFPSLILMAGVIQLQVFFFVQPISVFLRQFTSHNYRRLCDTAKTLRKECQDDEEIL